MPHKQRYAQPKRVMPAPFPALQLLGLGAQPPMHSFPIPNKTHAASSVQIAKQAEAIYVMFPRGGGGAGPQPPVEIKQAAAASVLHRTSLASPRLLHLPAPLQGLRSPARALEV